jgi:hypothetical protein
MLLTLSTARASLLVEPVVGYNFGAGTRADVGDGRSTFDGASGLGYGGRLGLQNWGFQFGLDYLRSNISFDDSALRDDLRLEEWGAFVGYRFPILLRVYGGYIFNANGNTRFTQAGERGRIDVGSGTGLKLGAGWTLLPWLDVNLEYRRLSFDNTNVEGITSNRDTDFSAYFIGLSLPLTFF